MKRLAPIALGVVLLWLVGYPLLVTFSAALAGGGGPEAPLGRFARAPAEWLALWRSFWISVASVAGAALLGIPLGFLFERRDFPGKALLGALVALPVALPPLVGVIAFLFLFGESGFLSRAVMALLGRTEPPWRLAGPGAILLVHAYSMYVYFYLFTRAGLARRDGALEEAAATLGASPRKVLWRITLPMLSPAFAGAALLCFMTSLGSFSAPYLFGGSWRVMTTQIVASKLNGDLGLAQVETVALALVAMVSLLALRRLEPRRKLTGTVRGLAPRPRPLASSWARWGACASATVLTLVLLSPHLTLVLISLVPFGTWTIEPFPPVLSTGNYTGLLSSAESWRPVASSLWMAAVATLVALVLGFLAAHRAARGGKGGRFFEGLLALPWALPGTVFALALASTFSVHAPWLGRIVLVGTPWILPLAYVVRALPLTGRSALAGLAQLDGSLDEAAATLGAGPWRRFARITLPLLRPSLVAGAGLAFMTALGDYVTSIVLYTFDNRPISMAIDGILRRNDLGLAAVYGVFLMLASSAAFLAWGRERQAG
ncbi:MAG: iron ABC transporter permease [Thermoanaerobaculia bacterium]